MPPKLITASEAAFEYIRDLIVGGELQPGQRLDQDALAAALGLSRTPVRQAIERLATNGLVEYRRRQGAIVTPLNARHMTEIYAIRARNEGWAAALATPRMTENDFDRLDALCREGDEALSGGDLPHHMEVNRNFHLYIYERADMPVLYGIIQNLWTQSERYRVRHATDPRQVAANHADHARIVDALRRRDSAAVEKLTVSHQLGTLRAMLRDLPAGAVGLDLASLGLAEL